MLSLDSIFERELECVVDCFFEDALSKFEIQKNQCKTLIN